MLGLYEDADYAYIVQEAGHGGDLKTLLKVSAGRGRGEAGHGADLQAALIVRAGQAGRGRGQLYSCREACYCYCHCLVFTEPPSTKKR